jgi:hypothetical protein
MEEQSGDKLFTPNDIVKINSVIENYGGTASPGGKLQIKVKGKQILEKFSTEVRSLPGVLPNSRTKLVGALSATVGSAYARSVVGVQGAIEKNQGGSEPQSIKEFDLKSAVHFPLELQSIVLARKPRVNEEVEATLTYKNLLEDPTESNEIALSNSSQNMVTVTGSPFTLPALSPGEQHTAKVKLKPGVWVGDNVPIIFQSKVTNDAGGLNNVTQHFSQIINVDRSASLLLFDNGGQPAPSGRFNVNAGSRISFLVKFNYLATRSLPGPFLVTASSRSHPTIRNSNNSTTSVNYGSWNPGSQAQPIRFSYDIPTELKGQNAWVMIQLDEGGRTVHALMVYLSVR